MYNNFPKIIFLLVIGFNLISCDLLTTRDAEDPDQGRSSYVIATTGDQLFTNLKNSFTEKVLKDYESSFVDSSFLSLPYIFTPSSEAIFKYSILSEWELEDESAYFQRLINEIGENDKIIVSLQLLSSSSSGDSESRNYNYSISIPKINESTSSIYEGNAFFKIDRDENSQWVITEWTDTRTGDNPSWSELKGMFISF